MNPLTNILFIVVYLVLIASSPTTVARIVRGAEQYEKDRFIIVTRKVGAGDAVNIIPLLNLLQTKEIKVRQTILMGSRAFVVAQTESAKLDFLLDSELVDFIEQDGRVALCKPSSVSPFTPSKSSAGGDGGSPLLRRSSTETNGSCYEQDVGQSGGWGLVRTSYHDTPDYVKEPYTYHHQGAGVDIYVMDTGVDVTHEEFEGRAAYGMVASDLNTSKEDLNGHGTNVAGIAAGKTYGAAKNASVISCKILGDDGFGTLSGVLEGLAWVRDRVNRQRNESCNPRAVINMSLDSRGPSPAEEAAIEEAVDEGITVIVAAGNNGEDTCGFSPAAFGEVITVAASASNDTLADFSNWGRCVDIVAPGVNIVGPWSSASSFCADRLASELTGCYAKVNGTSQATPFVTGTVAKYLESLSDEDLSSLSAMDVKEMILNTASVGYLRMQREYAGETPNRILFSDCGEEIQWPLYPHVVRSSANRQVSLVQGIILLCALFIYHCV